MRGVAVGRNQNIWTTETRRRGEEEEYQGTSGASRSAYIQKGLSNFPLSFVFSVTPWAPGFNIRNTNPTSYVL